MAEAYPDRYTTKAGVFLIGIQLRTGPRCRLHPGPGGQPVGNTGTKSYGKRLSFRGSPIGTAEYRERARAGTSRGEDDRTAPRGGAEGHPDWADLYSTRR
jgi:hypothetical protein